MISLEWRTASLGVLGDANGRRKHPDTGEKVFCGDPFLGVGTALTVFNPVEGKIEMGLVSQNYKEC